MQDALDEGGSPKGEGGSDSHPGPRLCKSDHFTIGLMSTGLRVR
jgi:hypothetical protein